MVSVGLPMLNATLSGQVRFVLCFLNPEAVECGQEGLVPKILDLHGGLDGDWVYLLSSN